MNKKIIILIAVIIVFFGVFIFLNYFSEEEPIFVPKPEPEEIKDIISANNQFALDLYSKVKDQEENIFFSPYSLSIALAMAYEGAKNETAKEIENVFYFPKDNQGRRDSYFNLQNWLLRKNTQHEINVANALWPQKDFSFSDDYFNVISKYYQGLIESLDFVERPEQSRKRINEWVEAQTKGKIENLIAEGTISPLTRLILTNAIYFKGEWLQEFNEVNTKTDSFYIAPNESIRVEMMQRLDDEAKFPYYAENDFQVLEMPYSGEETSMLVLLPKERDLTVLEEQLTVKNINHWQENLTKQRVKVYFPKFKLETKYFLKPVLGAMGMPKSFSDSADFSGITGQKDLFISEVIHQAFVEVDEKGTEAAAATGIVMELTAMPEEPVPVFRADRPFIFIIQEKETGTILFIGKVKNPE